MMIRSNKATNVSTDQRGAAFVEFVLIFPIFLVILFIILFIATMLNARTSLAGAVSTAVRLAYTRGQAELVGSEIIQEVENWRNQPPCAEPNSTFLKGLLATPAEQGAAFAPGGHYTTAAIGVLGQCYNHPEVPEHYIYSHIYALQAMKRSVGDSVRFPCDPNTPGGSGCMNCVSLNSMTYSEQYFDVTDPTYVNEWIGIKCEYRPANFLLRPIELLIGLITGNPASYMFLIERSSVFDPRQFNS